MGHYLSEMEGDTPDRYEGQMRKAKEGPVVSDLMKANLEVISDIIDEVSRLRERLSPVWRAVPSLAEKDVNDDSSQPSLLVDLQIHHRQLYGIRNELKDLVAGLML